MRDFFEKVSEAHDVKCPICGTKPSFEITGRHAYTTSSCAHKELEELLEKREYDIFVEKPPVMIKPFVGCGKPTLTIKFGKD